MWADWIEAVLTRAGFRVLPRSTVLTAAGGDGRRPGQHPGRTRAPGGAPGHRGAVLRLPAFARRQVDLEDAVVGRRRGHPPPADPGPGQRGAGSPSRSTSIPPSTWPGWTRPRRPRSCSGPWTGPRSRWGGREARPRSPGSRARSRRSGTCPPGTPTSPAAGRRWNCCATSWPGGGRAVVVAQALYGLGGVGKTQLALEYAHRFMADYDLVWWVPSERAEEISGALADLARKMGLKVGDNVAEAAEAALEELRRDTTPHWLLIFDNADDPKQLEPYLPTGLGARPHHLAEPGLDALGRAAGGGRLHQGRERRAPAPARARPGHGRREASGRRAGPPAAGGRAGQRLAGADRDAGPGVRRAAGHPVHPDPGPEPAAGLPDAGRGDLEPVLRPAEAALARRGPAAAALRVLLARARSRWTCCTATR